MISRCLVNEKLLEMISLQNTKDIMKQLTLSFNFVLLIEFIVGIVLAAQELVKKL